MIEAGRVEVTPDDRKRAVLLWWPREQRQIAEARMVRSIREWAERGGELWMRINVEGVAEAIAQARAEGRAEGYRAGIDAAAGVAQKEGGNEDNYQRGMDAEDMARTIEAAIRALAVDEQTRSAARGTK